MIDEFWMKRALLLARKALNVNKMPIASVLVYKNSEIGHGFNYADFFIYPHYHSEIFSLKQGTFYISDFLLNNASMYITLEPCSLCLYLSFLFKIKTVIFATYSKHISHTLSKYESGPMMKGGVLSDESLMLLKTFFLKNRSWCQ